MNPAERKGSDLWVWFAVWIAAFATRLAAAWLLPNAELDGYSYAEIIRDWSGKLSAGTFGPADLFGFWLPLFQLLSAATNIFVHDALLAGKLCSAVSGAMTCVLVFAVADRLTRNKSLAFLAYGLVLFNPLHLLYSAAAMTDVPFGCAVLASLWFVLDRRWIAAATFAALAETIRLEGWTLICALPLLQLITERRISLVSLIILVVPPLAWLGISHHATGDWLTYFDRRAVYQHRYLEFHPTRFGFASPDIRQDVDYFILGANAFVLLMLVFSAAWCVRQVFVLGSDEGRKFEVLAVTIYAGGIAALFLLGYVTKLQPVILPRYGLVFFTLGLPVLVWALQATTDKLSSRWIRGAVIALAVALCLRGFVRQLPTIPKVVSDFVAQEQIASELRLRIGSARCFSDDPAVRLLSGLPADRFLRSQTTPAAAARERESFTHYLKEQQVGYLVFLRTEDSLAVDYFPELGRNDDNDVPGFHLIGIAFSAFGPDVSLYRLAPD